MGSESSKKLGPPISKEIDKIESKECKEIEMGCPICLTKFKDILFPPTVLECSHKFHKKCIAKWFEHFHNTCPICRRHVSWRTRDQICDKIHEPHVIDAKPRESRKRREAIYVNPILSVMAQVQIGIRDRFNDRPGKRHELLCPERSPFRIDNISEMPYRVYRVETNLC